MSLSSVIFPRADSALAAGKKKRVLLVDSSRIKRDLRSETMRKLGMEVDCAADISEARCWWRADLYDLVLLHVDGAALAVEKFCHDMRSATPPQQLRFLVGGPSYLSASPQFEESAPGSVDEVQQLSSQEVPPASGSDEKLQRWGILEACRRISAIRSVTDARARAIRNRPDPERDSEVSRLSRILVPPTVVEPEAVVEPETIEVIREELQ